MSKKFTLASLTLIGLLVLVFGDGSFAARRHTALSNTLKAGPQAVASQPPSDAELLKAVMANIRKGMTDAKLKAFKDAGFRFGISCQQGVVTLSGRAPGKANRAKIVALVGATKGVKRVIRKNFTGLIGHCPAGTIDCFGDGSVCAATQAECGTECCIPPGEGN
ncbi:MAG: BON domain-containing protein [Acidobacteria bacterium]|nr:BON domain-containing protein [Acidobacteriota bacterium]